MQILRTSLSVASFIVADYAKPSECFKRNASFLKIATRYSLPPENVGGFEKN